MSRTNYHKLNTYNTKPRGTVQGPRVPANVPTMAVQQPLYPQVNHGYNALTFNGGDREYYKIDNGPYGQKCSRNLKRNCLGGAPLIGRENYNTPSQSNSCVRGRRRENYLPCGAGGCGGSGEECGGGCVCKKSTTEPACPDCHPKTFTYCSALPHPRGAANSP